MKVNASLDNGSSKLDVTNSSEVSILTDEKEVEDNVDLLLEKNSDLADKRVVENISDPLLESSDCSTRAHNDAALEAFCNDVLTSVTNEQSQAIVEEVSFSPKPLCMSMSNIKQKKKLLNMHN